MSTLKVEQIQLFHIGVAQQKIIHLSM